MKEIRLEHADALDFLETIEDNTADLVILDPQYNDWEALINRGLLRKVRAKTKDTGNIITFTKQPFDQDLRRALDLGFIFKREIVWTFDNGNSWCSNRLPLIRHQKIYWATISDDFFFNPRTGQPYSPNTKSGKRANKVFEGYKREGKAFEMSEEGTWLCDHLHFDKPRAGALAAKPYDLMRILIRCFCPEGGTIIDPFAGSGVVVDIAKATDRSCFACDINPERVEDIKQRIIYRLF